MNFKKLFAIASTLLAGLFVFALPISAHVVVKPNQVGLSERVNFVVSVPTEMEVPTVSVRLVIPEGLQSVRPNVKPGWNIQLVKTGEGDEERITEIIWSGGRVPADQRDEFVFSAQAPSAETSLIWKAYQTYADGMIMSWDKDPKVVEEYAKNSVPKEGVGHDHDAPVPYSETKVVDDLKVTQSIVEERSASDNGSKTLSVVAILLSAVAIGLQFRKKK